MTEETKTEVIEYKLVDVPTQHVAAIQTPTGELLSIEQAIVELLNKVVELNKRI